MLNIFLASSDICRLQISFVNNLDPNQDRLNISPDLNLFDTLIVLLKEFFEKVHFEKKSADDNKSMKNYGKIRLDTSYESASSYLFGFLSIKTLLKERGDNVGTTSLMTLIMLLLPLATDLVSASNVCYIKSNALQDSLIKDANTYES